MPSAAIPAPEVGPLVASRPLPDAGVRIARAVGFTARLARRARARAWAPPPLGGGGLKVGNRAVVVERFGGEHPDAVVVVSCAGRMPGRRVAVSPFGLGVRDLTGHALGVYLYDRAGTGRSSADGPLTPGNPAHTEDWCAVLALARGEGVPVLALSFSAGILPVLRAAAEGHRPDALIDGEGPADRWSLVPPDGGELAAWDPWDDRRWVGLEAVSLIGQLGVPYARLQGAVDHVHGPMTEHARRLLVAARAAGLPVLDPGVLAGALHGHPQATLEALAWASRA